MCIWFTQVEDAASSDECLGTLKIGLSKLLKCPGMTCEEPFTLLNSGPYSQLTLRLTLRVSIRFSLRWNDNRFHYYWMFQHCYQWECKIYNLLIHYFQTNTNNIFRKILSCPLEGTGICNLSIHAFYLYAQHEKIDRWWSTEWCSSGY